MIEPVVNKHNMKDFDEIKQNLEYWLTRPPAERVAAVDYLRKQLYGDSIRLQRIVRVIKLEDNDIADLEALEEE